METSKDYSNFPKTRYRGSKRKLLPWLKGIFEEIEFDSFLDIFGGTGSVSYLMKTLRKEVTFNDYLVSNTVSAKALIKNNSIELKTTKFKQLFGKKLVEGVVSNNFKDIYYSEKENKEIDTLIKTINENKLPKLNGIEKDIVMHCLFQALLMKRPFNLFHRANLYLRTNKVERSFGNKTTWEKGIKELMNRSRIEVNKAVFNNNKKHNIYNLDALEVDPGYDLVYIDPPYYSAKKSGLNNYMRYYHFLEGLCDYENWKSKIDFNLKPNPITIDEHNFTKKSIEEDLKNLFETHSESIIALSYKSPGYPSIKELKKELGDTHKNIIVHSKKHKYSLNKNNGKYDEKVIIAYPLK